MAATLCNPQMVLGHLMSRFGRTLHCGKAEGHARMVLSVSKSLGLDQEESRRQVELLSGCGLLFFETDLSVGVWHIGPSV